MAIIQFDSLSAGQNVEVGQTVYCTSVNRPGLTLGRGYEITAFDKRTVAGVPGFIEIVDDLRKRDWHFPTQFSPSQSEMK